MIQQTFNDIYTDELAKDAIINNEFPGFREDYLVLHCLIKKYKPKSFFEIGTNLGSGTRIIKNAMGEEGVVFTLDLPFEQLHPSLVRGEKDIVGINCPLPYIQLRGDSMTFDYSKYPCEGYFIDGEHDYDHPRIEGYAAVEAGAKLIVFHDLHVVPVQNAVGEVFYRNRDYDVYRVTDTRIAYAIKK